MSTEDVPGTADNSPSGKNENKSNNNDLALSLDIINRNMGKLANLLAKLCEKPDSDERPLGLKRKSTCDVSDNSDSESEENSDSQVRKTTASR